MWVLGFGPGKWHDANSQKIAPKIKAPSRFFLEKSTKFNATPEEVKAQKELEKKERMKWIVFKKRKFQIFNEVKRIFFKILVIWANFGDFGDFDIDFKILKKSCKTCYPILGPILENFDHRILVKSQSYDKPPWRNFDFLSNFVEIENFGF